MRGLIVLLLVTAQVLALEPGELAQKVTPCVALLIQKNAFGQKKGSGTGFFIAPDRMVTNYHVIKGATTMTARLADRSEVKITEVLACSSAWDLAVLKVPKNSAAFLSLGDSQKLKVGDPVAVIGSPLGLSTVFSRGEVSAIREEGPDNEDLITDDTDTRAWRVQITAPTSHGSSGSPIVNAEGEVVAVAVGGFSEGEALNFGVPVQFLKDLLAGDLKPMPVASAAPSDSPVARNLAISAAFFVVVAVFWRMRLQA